MKEIFQKQRQVASHRVNSVEADSL